MESSFLHAKIIEARSYLEYGEITTASDLITYVRYLPVNKLGQSFENSEIIDVQSG